MTDPIVPADKRLRRFTILAAVLVAAVGGLLLYLLVRHLAALRDCDKPKENVAELAVLLNTFAGLTAAIFLGIATWFFVFCRRVAREGCYPPPGMKVVRDTPVHTGPAAVRVARLALLQGFLALAAAAAVGALWWYALGMIQAMLES